MDGQFSSGNVADGRMFFGSFDHFRERVHLMMLCDGDMCKSHFFRLSEIGFHGAGGIITPAGVKMKVEGRMLIRHNNYLITYLVITEP